MTENKNPCYETCSSIFFKGSKPETCFEGTAKADECIVLVKGGTWEDCRYGGKWNVKSKEA